MVMFADQSFDRSLLIAVQRSSIRTQGDGVRFVVDVKASLEDEFFCRSKFSVHSCSKTIKYKVQMKIFNWQPSKR
jgi:hypothetical protein